MDSHLHFIFVSSPLPLSLSRDFPLLPENPKFYPTSPSVLLATASGIISSFSSHFSRRHSHCTFIDFLFSYSAVLTRCCQLWCTPLPSTPLCVALLQTGKIQISQKILLKLVSNFFENALCFINCNIVKISM